MKTTPRENLLRTLRRQGFDWAPLEPNCFCPSQLEAFKKRFGNDDYLSYFNAPSRSVGVPMKPSFTDGHALFKREQLPEDVQFSAFGVGHSKQPNCFHMSRMHHPLRGEDVTREEVLNYPLPTIMPDAEKIVADQVAELKGKGFATMACMACSIWETSWYIRSMEDLMVDMVNDDERATLLFDRITEGTCQRMRVAARAGVDIVQLGDDIGMQSSPMMAVVMWEKWLKPRLTRLIAAGKEIKPDLLVFYHSCGYVLPFIDGLIEAGVDILNPVQPECMSFEEVHSRFGDRLSFWSTIGTQTTLPFGKPEEVKEVVQKNLRICGKKGGIVIGPTHMVEPEVPWENLLAMKEACETFSALTLHNR